MDDGSNSFATASLTDSCCSLCLSFATATRWSTFLNSAHWTPCFVSASRCDAGERLSALRVPSSGRLAAEARYGSAQSRAREGGIHSSTGSRRGWAARVPEGAPSRTRPLGQALARPHPGLPTAAYRISPHQPIPQLDASRAATLDAPRGPHIQTGTEPLPQLGSCVERPRKAAAQSRQLLSRGNEACGQRQVHVLKATVYIWRQCIITPCSEPGTLLRLRFRRVGLVIAFLGALACSSMLRGQCSTCFRQDFLNGLLPHTLPFGLARLPCFPRFFQVR
eukprot:scaffold1717_cov377-Prasinococcus_capsulatus_cf.AAC.8